MARKSMEALYASRRSWASSVIMQGSRVESGGVASNCWAGTGKGERERGKARSGRGTGTGTFTGGAGRVQRVSGSRRQRLAPAGETKSAARDGDAREGLGGEAAYPERGAGRPAGHD